ncbi:MAG: HAMP domain-containing histidine kinase [Elusimicrobia bacterium]|nr:HAMP domain-containing histidine kinase [Elusimicrobiota bacterium]
MAARKAVTTAQDMIAVVSHDMRAPIAAIKGCAETLRRGALSDPVHRGGFVRVIERHAGLLLDLVEDLLLFAALDHGRPCASESLSLREAVLAAIRGLKPHARSRRVAVSASVEPGLRAVVDRRRLAQVLQNLLGNAIKYNRPRGRVAVAARTLGAMVRVDVADTGIGIERGELPGIFQQFHRTAAARQRCHGTGLGLSIVKRIVECHGGRVWVESAPGFGSTFSFTVPASLAACRRRMWGKCRSRREGAPPCSPCPFHRRLDREPERAGGRPAALSAARVRLASFRSRSRSACGRLSLACGPSDRCAPASFRPA